jgi:hypothetical protein
MNWEWAFGDFILLALAFYELWSLRKYKREDAKVERTAPPEPRQD